jgi:hypothetical protein
MAGCSTKSSRVMATLVEVAQACMQCSKSCTGTTCITHKIQRGCKLLYGSFAARVLCVPGVRWHTSWQTQPWGHICTGCEPV